MLIEFSGPSASGKTEFVRHLLKTWPETRSVRRSVSAIASPTGPKFRAALSHAHEPARVFWNAYKWHQHGLGLSNKPIRTSLRMAAEYSLLRGLSKDSRLWLLDQGRMQLASWLPQQVCDDPSSCAESLKKFVRIGDGLVLISMPPEVAIERIKARGDIRKMEDFSSARGFSSPAQYFKNLREQESRKIDLLKRFNCVILQNIIGDDGEIDKQILYGRSGELVQRMHSLGEMFGAWWRRGFSQV